MPVNVYEQKPAPARLTWEPKKIGHEYGHEYGHVHGHGHGWIYGVFPIS